MNSALIPCNFKAERYTIRLGLFNSMDKRFIAECVGTFTLSFVVLLSSAYQYVIPTPLLAALVLMLFVYSIGSISGCHMNPAVTIGLWSLKKITLKDSLLYIVSQLVGALLALVLANIAGMKLGGILSIPMQSYLLELLGMGIFTFGIASVVFDEQKSLVSGIIVGGSLLLGISISVLGGAAGILNPAVGLALKNTQIGYYLAEIGGSVIGFQLYAYLISRPSGKRR